MLALSNKERFFGGGEQKDDTVRGWLLYKQTTTHNEVQSVLKSSSLSTLQEQRSVTITSGEKCCVIEVYKWTLI
jgi:hypothetical protein